MSKRQRDYERAREKGRGRPQFKQYNKSRHLIFQIAFYNKILIRLLLQNIFTQKHTNSTHTRTHIVLFTMYENAQSLQMYRMQWKHVLMSYILIDTVLLIEKTKNIAHINLVDFLINLKYTTKNNAKTKKKLQSIIEL